MAHPAPAAARVVAEEPAPDTSGLYTHTGWAAAMPWLVQGITDRSADMSIFADSPAGAVMQRWRQLRDALGCGVLIHARQVHEAGVIVHEEMPAGVLVVDDADGHITSRPAALLTVSVADCVPIYLAAPDVHAIALLHGGWRGVAAGILEHGISTLVRRCGASAAALRLHLGPAICGGCFEVGPEVSAQLNLVHDGADRAHIDLRAVLLQRAQACGVQFAHMTTSQHCTRCGDSPFFSHRGGCRERQLAVLAIRGSGH